MSKKLKTIVAFAMIVAMLFGLLCAGCTPGAQILSKIAIKDLTVDAATVKKDIAKIENFTVSDNLAIDLLVNADEYYDLTLSMPHQHNFADFYSQGVAFAETVLGEKINPHAFYYLGQNSQYKYNYDVNPDTGELIVDGKPVPEGFEAKVIGAPNKIADYYGKLASGEEDYWCITYEPSFIVDDPNKNVYFAFCNPIGIGYLRFNNGEIARALPPDNGEMPNLGTWLPAMTEEMTAEYEPNSTTEVELSDGKITVADAVKQCNKFIASLPCAYDKTLNLEVAKVQSFAIGEKAGLRFQLSLSHKGSVFEYGMVFDQHSEFDGYTRIVCEAYMYESEKIDILYNYTVAYVVEEKERHTEVISPASAISIISEALTKEIPFEVNKIELMDCITAPKSAAYSEQRQNVALAWKITLFSPNDNMTYVTYVDAKDGGNLRYYVIYPE